MTWKHDGALIWLGLRLLRAQHAPGRIWACDHLLPRPLRGDGGVHVKNHCVGLRAAPPKSKLQLATASFRDQFNQFNQFNQSHRNRTNRTFLWTLQDLTESNTARLSGAKFLAKYSVLVQGHQRSSGHFCPIPGQERNTSCSICLVNQLRSQLATEYRPASRTTQQMVPPYATSNQA